MAHVIKIEQVCSLLSAPFELRKTHPHGSQSFRCPRKVEPIQQMKDRLLWVAGLFSSFTMVIITCANRFVNNLFYNLYNLSK